MADVTLSATFRDGTIIRATGFIELETWESMDEKLTLTMIPRDNRWEVFSGTLPDTTGSLSGVSIAGVPYRILGDGNVSMIPSEWKNEAVPTSGTNLRRMTRQARALSGVTIACTPTELETLRLISQS